METQNPNINPVAVNLRCITARVLAATEAGDLDALEQALDERALTLQALQENIVPSVPSCDLPAAVEALAAALQDGDKALAALITMKQRLQAEHGRITLQTHLVQTNLAQTKLSHTNPADAGLARTEPQPNPASDLEIIIPVLWDSSTGEALRACETQLDLTA